MGDEKRLSLEQACLRLISDIANLKHPSSDVSLCYELAAFDEQQFFLGLRGLPRIIYKSRDQELEFFGMGAADLIKAQDHAGALQLIVKKSQSLLDHQVYLGVMRFDEQAQVAQEWQNFGNQFFMLPLILVKKSAEHLLLSLNYKKDGSLDFNTWRDQALSFLHAIMAEQKPRSSAIDCVMGTIVPSAFAYEQKIAEAKRRFDGSCRKVVMGRRTGVHLKHALDPIELFFRLTRTAHKAFLFFFDDGKTSAFFGGSPELLYRRSKNHLFTESLAGTRARCVDAQENHRLKYDLFHSVKDNQEHAFVSAHIEEKLHELGGTDVLKHDLEIMELPYVQHLLRRYSATIGSHIDDATIVQKLHPTPAVCGLDIAFAYQFIRDHEEFDRGCYAGPVGFIGPHEAEFAVAIRSALFYEQELFIYAACGIVSASTFEAEWEELNNKEKNILTIFS